MLFFCDRAGYEIHADGRRFEAAAKAIEAGSTDLANLATARLRLKAPKSYLAHVMSANPDGSVGISTISQWRYIVWIPAKTMSFSSSPGDRMPSISRKSARGVAVHSGVSVDGRAYASSFT